MLEDEGLHQAKISYQLSPHPDTRQMDITVRVVPGPRARVGALHLINETPFSEAELRGQLRLKPKTEVTSERLDQDTERVRKWLAARGYLGARVSVTRGSYDAGTNQLPLEIHLFAGLKVEVRVAGAKVSSRTLHRLLPIYEEGAVDDDLLQEGRRNLRDYFQGQGYFDTDVNYVTSETPAKRRPVQARRRHPRPIITAAPSARRTPARRRSPTRSSAARDGAWWESSFTGNHYFDDEILRSRVRIQPAGFDSPGRFSSAQLASDVASLTDIYHANGFRSVHVNSDVQENYGGKSEDLFVRFEVQEGPQTRVADLKLEGNKALSDSELLRVIGSAAGQPFSDFNVAGDRDNVLALYYDQGFPAARFTSTVEDAARSRLSARPSRSAHLPHR